MSFRELMSKHNLLGGRYSVPPTSPPSPPLLQRGQVLLQKELLSLFLFGMDVSISRKRVPIFSKDVSIFSKKICITSTKKKVVKFFTSNVVLPKNNRIHTNTGFMLLEKKNPETNEQEASVSQNDLGEAMGRFAGQRRMAERLKDPIVVKTKDEFECIQIKIPHPKKESQCPSSGGGH